MATIENNLSGQDPKHQETSEAHIQFLNTDLERPGLEHLDLNNPDMLRPTIDRINTMHLHQFNPVRFRFIESMAEKALQYRMPVSENIEKKAMQALSCYVKEYASFQKRTESLDSHKKYSQKNKHQGGLARLTQEMFQSSDAEAFASEQTLEEQLRQLEKDVMHSVAGAVANTSTDNNNENNSDLPVNVQSKTGYNELSVMRDFRQSQVKHNSERLLTRTIQEGPVDAGPLNSQALIIRSLTTMRDLSPSYINRFVAYMDTLLWLEQAGEEGAKTKKTKNKVRRKS